MDTFTASNGVEITIKAEENETYLLGKGEQITGGDRHWTVATGNLDGINALREFFQAERDEELGRWRWPEDSRFVVYPGYSPGEEERYVRVVEENTGVSTLVYESQKDGVRGHNVACAYFEAHPESKPWHDAKPGEVWVIDQANTVTTAARAALVNERMKFEPVNNITRHIDVDDSSILDARRIWPEVSDADR